MALKHAKSGEIVDLSPQGATLADQRSTAIVKTDGFEAIRLVVPSGGLLKSHKVPGPITLHCLEGHVVLDLPDGAIDLKANGWVHLDGGVPHGIRGIKDAALLLTILLAESDDTAGDTGADKGQDLVFDRYEDCGCADRWEGEGGHPVND